MENASKALIIAGAILLSILIISLGIIVFQNAKGATDTSSVDGLAVDTFNSKFTQYTGNKVKGANVNALLQSIVANNLTNTEDESKMIQVTISASDWTNPSGSSGSFSKPDKKRVKNIKECGSAQTGKAYSVSFTFDSDSGYIDTCTIGNAN